MTRATSARAAGRRLLLYASLFSVAAAVLAVPFLSASCQTRQAPNERQALEVLRTMTRRGTLPADERQPARVETDYPGTRAGALARLVRARVRQKAGDAAGAAQLLDAPAFRQQTSIADYALFLRAAALEQAGRRVEARAAYEQLAREYPASLRAREAVLRNAELVMADNQAAAVPLLLQPLTATDDPAALLLAARAHEQQNEGLKALALYRRLYFFAPASPESAEAAQAIARLNSALAPATPAEALARADKLFAAKQSADAANAYAQAFSLFPVLATPEARLRQGIALGNSKRATEAVSALLAVPASAGDVAAEALFQLADVYAGARQWALSRGAIEQLRARFPQSELAARAYVAAGLEAKEAKNTAEAFNFFRAAVAAYPGRAEVTPAQFELAWAAHEAKNYGEAARLLIEHVALYADKNSDYRGRAGYWAARDAERAGLRAEARALYEALQARYDATWYGYLAKQRLAEMSKAGGGSSQGSFTAETPVGRAVANLKLVTVAEETAGPAEYEAINRAEQLSLVGLEDWTLEELKAAQQRAPASPRVNLALAAVYRAKDDNVTAFNLLRRSFPDYAQMEPEELTREQWDVFYPLAHWEIIVAESRARGLDPHQVAGLIRQESVFNPRARSAARAYGLMQLLVPTGRLVAQRYGVESGPITEETLYEPRLNIQLGTAYMREQMDRFGRLEYTAAAYNAGPGRVVTWRASLPPDLDEWAEAVPFKETRGYIQGVVRNMLQYERLYDDQGRFRPEVGSRAVRPLAGETNAAPPAGESVRPRRAAGSGEE